MIELVHERFSLENGCFFFLRNTFKFFVKVSIYHTDATEKYIPIDSLSIT